MLQIYPFLQKNISRPFLLGLSGGEDSSCLFHLLIKAKASFAAVYVDHQWREESKEEGRILKELCEKHNVPFYLETISYLEKIENIEDFCRNERLKIFDTLVKKHDYQGVMLAHHALDQAETVLKRVFEGSSLLKIKGMEEISAHNDLKIFRPLLGVSKDAIKKYVKENQITYFEDRTNTDPRYLRARMRQELFPLIEKKFGKKIEKPLSRIAEEAKLLNDFMDMRTEELFKESKWGPLGYSLDLSKASLHEAEALHLLRRVLKTLGITLARSQLFDAVKHLLLKSPHKKFSREHKTLNIDRGVIHAD